MFKKKNPNTSLSAIFSTKIEEKDDEFEFIKKITDFFKNKFEKKKDYSICEIIIYLKKNPEEVLSIQNYLTNNFSNQKIENLLENAGIINDLDFFFELKKRIAYKFIPEQSSKQSIQYSLNQIFLKSDDASWIFKVPFEEWVELFNLLKLKTIYVAKDNEVINEILLSMHILSQRMGGLALQKDIIRMVPEYSNLESPFLEYDKELNLIVNKLVASKQNYLEYSEEDVKQLKILNNQCLDFIDKVYENSSKYGISFRVNQSLLTIKEQLERIDELSVFLFVKDEQNKIENTILFYLKIIKYNSYKNNINKLIKDGVYNITYEITNHTAKTGEKYITNSRAEYFKMLYSSSVGGIIVAFLCIFKLYFSTLKTSDFGYALLYSLNYASGFVLIYLVGAALATKQPAMTATTISKSLEVNLNSKDDKIEQYRDFARLFARLFRSQFIAFVGNVLVAFPVALLLIWSIYTLFDYDMALAKYPKLINDLNPIKSAAVFHAAIAGFFLFLSGIVAGNIANKNKFNNLYYRISEHPILKKTLGKTKTNKISTWLENKWPGVVSNLFFGFCLGSTASIGNFLGLNLDIRHITFASGNFAIGVFGANYQLDLNVIIWSIVGIFLIGFMNFIVSFSFSLFIALQSMKIPTKELKYLNIAIWERFKKYPFQFFLPINRKN